MGRVLLCGLRWYFPQSTYFLYSPAVFTLNFLLLTYEQFFSISPFWRPKGCKRHSAEKNQLLAPRLTNFRKRKYCLRRTSAALAYNCKQACILLAGTNFASFVVRLPSPFLCKSWERQVWPHLRCVRKLATLFRALLQPAPVIFTALYFF